MKPPADGPRYAIGIDLGTTNCSLAYVDLEDPQLAWQLLAIPQWEGEGQLMNDVRLPSFAWILPKAIVKRQSRLLPWQGPTDTPRVVLGREAKFRALEASDQVAFAAKSWLSVGPRSTRQAPILPWGSASLIGDQKLSPLEVQTLLLEHLSQAWNAQFAGAPQQAAFHQQSIVITVPASFDELAQRLTLEAAQLAGFPAAIELLEEPQAAFYTWLASATHNPPVQPQRLLVCDIGGGTSDFTLLDRQFTDGQDRVKRLRVSDHILLGGDNIDLSLAAELQARMGPEELPRSAWHQLLAQARQLKESVLADSGDHAEIFHVSVPLQAGQLFGAYASVSIQRGEILKLIVEGFFPTVAADAKPFKTSAGLRNLGLAFPEDSAITRHLAGFLAGENVDALLCAGGTLLPECLRQRIQELVELWQGTPVELLELPEADLAIARGAAWYLAKKLSGSSLVTSHYPRSLYLELADPEGHAQYLCVVRKGQVRQQRVRLDSLPLQLRLGQKVGFQLYSSVQEARLQTSERHEDWMPLPLLTAELKGVGTARLIPVVIESVVRETGVLELSCCARDDETLKWTLDFSLDATAPETEASQTSSATSSSAPSAQELRAAMAAIEQAFGKAPSQEGRVQQLPKELESTLHRPREDWSIQILRELWDALQKGMHRRERSISQEATWMYLSGFCLRPGWGSSGDSERIRKLWPLFEQGLSKTSGLERRLQDQFYLMWRRVAGGLNANQQSKVLDKIMPQLRKQQDVSAEMIRLAASLERVPHEKKITLGRLFLQQITQGQRDQLDARTWALARLGSRFPLYAGTEAVLPPHVIEEWSLELKQLPWPSKLYQRLVLFYQLAGRLRGDRALDLDAPYRQHFIERLEQAGVDATVLESLRSVCARDTEFQQQLFGETLPAGLMIVGSQLDVAK